MAIDISKRIFQFHGVDSKGRTILTKRLMRDQVLVFMSNIPKCLVGIEACGGSNYWAREIRKLGHDVKLIAAQFVKPYVKTNKNDKADAEAICEAVSRPTMRFVSIKTTKQQDLLSIHRVRKRLIKNRTALSNEIRGLLLEFGHTIPKGVNHISDKLIQILNENNLSAISQQTFNDLHSEFIDNDKRIKAIDLRLKILSEQSAKYHLLRTIPGIGLISASALIASIGTVNEFQNARQLSAWLGLVPKQNSSGGKDKLLGISKRGDTYLRELLVHGARAVLSARIRMANKENNDNPRITSNFASWIFKLEETKGYSKAVVAIANKLARVVYSVLKNNQPYEEYKLCY